MSNQPYIIGPGERPPNPNMRINDCLNYSGLATEQELQFLKLPSENQGFFSKVGNFLAGIVGSSPTTNSGGTQISTNNSLPSAGLPQISSSNLQQQPIQLPSQTNTAVNYQTSANLTPQNRGKNPQPTAKISTTVNNSNSQSSTNIGKSRSKTAMTLEESVEFAENPEPRCPLVLLLDVSQSMSDLVDVSESMSGNKKSGNKKIDKLNEGIQILKEELEKDDLAKLRVEVAIVSFGQQVNVVQDFVTVDKFEPPTLETAGQTFMGTGINKALDMVSERKNIYKEHHIGYYRPWVFMITDGEPQGEDDEVIKGASQRIKEMEDGNEVAFFAVGVEGANMEKLKGIIIKRAPLKLKGIDFREMFIWLSNSMKSKSHSQIGESVPLTFPGWASE